MDLTFDCTLFFLFIYYVHAKSNPEVHEDRTDSKAIAKKNHKVPFNFSATKQQDQQVLRYLQQQRVDLANWARNKTDKKERIRRSFSINQQHKSKRGVEVNPVGLEGHVQKPELEALTALIGKHPNVQLQGLRFLLGHYPQYYRYVPVPNNIPHHIPIKEHVQDVPNVQERPNVQVATNQKTVADFQAHFNAMAQQIVAQAQKKAQEAVEAQHRAILLAQEKANREFALIEARNRANLAKQNVIFVTPNSLEDNAVEIQAAPLVEFHERPNKPVIRPKEVKHKETNLDYDDNLHYASKYAFGYRIRDFHSGNDYGHEEVNEGNQVKGHYHVLLPDGRLQSVQYWADKSGFHSKVTYENVAKH